MLRGFRDLSIRRKLILIMMLTSSASLLLASIAFLTNDTLTLRRTLTEDLVTLTDMIGANSTAALLFDDREAAAETLGILRKQTSIMKAEIYDLSGVLFAEYVRSGIISSKEQPVVSSPGKIRLWDDYIETHRDIVLDSEVVGRVYVRSDTSKLRERLLWYMAIFAGVLLVAVLVAYLLSARLQRVVTDPIVRLATIARRISAEKDYRLRAQTEAHDEVGDLIDGFNEMLTEIQNRDTELELHREQLEQLVGRRTSELEAANTQLALAKERAESAAEKMAYQAYHDSLTGLPNRALMNDRLVTALAHAHREVEMLAVLFLDLDRFKVINDSLGHLFGDQVLCAVGERLQSCVRAEDTIARVGGDEFMILLQNVESATDAGNVAKKITDVLMDPIYCNDQELHITTSIGISIYPDDGVDSVTLMKQADIAMYRAKEKGLNTYLYYTADMDALSHHRLTLENSLRKAIEREELEIFYQPKVDTISREIIGAEALIRWRHPEFGVVSPEQIIPLAEETGLIAAIGEWMLYTACKQEKKWLDAGHTVARVAVNLSAEEIGRRYMFDTVDRVLRETGLDPNNLELEITENALMQNAQTTIAVLRKFKDLGIHISIDDFGTGYSSLSYLRRFPIDSIKIDSSFVHEIPHNAEDASIATAIIAMAHSLNMTVVAEGVENRHQLRFFREKGCEAVQGYLLSPPVPAAEFTHLLEKASPSAAVGTAD
ncbi:MAG: EAL domain-containing protein [Gammaproteobacteria bacterium]